MKLPRILMLGCIVLMAACATPQNPAPVGDLNLEDQFRWVAFHGDQGEPHNLMRWETPIRAVTVGASERDRQKVENHLALLAELTGLEVSVDHVERGAITFPIDLDGDHNMVVVFDNAETLFPYARAVASMLSIGLRSADHFTCAFVSSPSDSGRIAGALILIRNDPVIGTVGQEIIRGCVAQEITQSLGLTGDLDNHVATIFSSFSVYIHPTADDRRLVRILYDSRLTPGMTEDQAAPIIRQIIAENDW